MKQEAQASLRALSPNQNVKQDIKLDRDAVLNNVHEAILMIDEVGLVQFANEAAQNLLGFHTVKEMMSKHYTAVLELQCADGHPVPVKDQPWHKVVETGEVFTSDPTDPHYAITRDGRKMPIMLSVSPLLRRNQIVGGSIIFHELKPRVVQDAPIDFISLASHQLRTPLTVANLHVDMLLAGHMGKMSDEQRKVLEEISFYHQKVNQVLVEFLVASRVELGTFAVDLKSLDIVAKVQEVVRDFTPELKHKHISLKTDFAENVPPSLSDSQIVRIVVHNVLSNAIKFGKAEGAVEVSVKAKGDRIVITIKDDGVGIAPADQSKIFDKMFRGDNVGHNRSSGIGFGLYIVKSLLDLCQGEITFKSEENKGTTFYLSFPKAGKSQ